MEKPKTEEELIARIQAETTDAIGFDDEIQHQRDKYGNGKSLEYTDY